jgi:hypothetical protein
VGVQEWRSGKNVDCLQFCISWSGACMSWDDFRFQFRNDHIVRKSGMVAN